MHGSSSTSKSDVILKMALDPAPAQVEDWCLVDGDGNKYKLPKTMLFMGSDECDIVVRSQTVDKRHAVITFDHYLNKFKIKDLTTANGTFVNEARIQDQEYVTLEHMDSVRLGYDSMVYRMEEVREDVNFNTEMDVPPQTNTSMPSWATKELPQPMAECQGCIAEQQIEHTCVGNEDHSDFRLSNHDHMMYDDNYEHRYHNYTYDNGNKQQSKDFGCNTWPRKRMRNVKNIATYFTDDLTNGTSLDDSDHSHNRILRGESSHPENLPSELETVKKATPLYGQPDWWGEEDANHNDSTKPHNGSGNVKEIHHSHSAHFMDDTVSAHRQGSLDRDVKLSPAQEMPSVASSLSKDSLLSHDPGGSSTPDASPGFKKVTDKGDNSLGKITKSSESGGSTCMAFTVDFDEDTPKMNMSGKLSEFMPSKIRKSFRERKEKAMTRTSSKDGSPEKEEPSPKLESSDISPERQKRIDDLWESPDSKKKKTPDTRRSSRSHDSDTERKTPEVKKVSRTSHGGEVDKKTPESKRLSRSLDAEAENKPVTAISAKGTSTKTHKRKVTSGEPKKSTAMRQREDVSVTSSSVTESASYLIDKMFESGNAKTGKSSTLISRKSPRNIADRFTEHAMYREAKQYDTGKFKSKESDLKTTKTKTKEELKSSLPEKDIDEVREGGDNVSEAGTYTIDADKDDSEEKQAREDIDRIFGVTSIEDVLSQTDVGDKKVINQTNNSTNAEKRKQADKGEITLEDLDTEIEKLEHDRAKGPEASSMEVEVGSTALQELRIVEDTENASSVLPDDAPAWVTQWAALTNQKSQSKSANMEAPSPSSVHSLSSEKDELRSSPKKTSQGLRRRGTGRKLPRVPAGDKDKGSPSGSEYSSKVSESTGSPSGLTPRQGEYSDNNKLKAVTISSQVTSRYEDTDTETISKTKFSSDSDSTLTTNRLLGPESERTSGSSRSARSLGSLDTEILLKDTEKVMAAMEARMGTEGVGVDEDLQLNGHNDSFSDNDSMVALVNGDESYMKPTHYESPRANLQKSTPSKQQKPVLSRTKSAGARLNAFRENLKRQQSLDKTVVSDVLSETATESSCGGSENGDYGANNFARTNSKGKGKMSMTRPNRAFQLRRARADADEPSTPNSASTLTNVSKTSSHSVVTSSVTPKTPQTKSRHSLGTDRTDKSYDSARSEASLGAQIVARSRINNARSTGDLVRRDGGRHSLRMSNRSLSSQESASSSTDVRKSDFKAIKARLKNPPSYGLTVTGVSKSSSQSLNNSRTSSPKSAEKAAWKRRKEYDPRKAVAEAKIKAKDSRNISYAAEKSLNANRKMTRSASFTNSSELRRFRKDVKSDSLSSADDISSCTNSEVTDTFDERTLSSRSFIPYTGRSHSSRLYHSSEDEELGLLVKSSQDLSRCLLGSVPYMSAFTPPPPKLTSSSPVSPIPLSVFKPRVSNEINSHKLNLVNDHLSLSRNISDLPLSLQSYDNILVSSIYQLSLKLKTATDKSLQKLKDHQRIENGTSPSPIEELLDQPGTGDMPAWKSANQELAGILNNLRKIEHHVHVMNTVLFPGEDLGLDKSTSTRKEKQEYLQEIERIRSELAGFQPITTPDEVWKMRDGEESVESDCEELGVPEEFF